MNKRTLIWCVEPTRNKSGRHSHGTAPGLAIGADQWCVYETPGEGGAGRAKCPAATMRAMAMPVRGRRWFPDWGYEPAPHVSGPESAMPLLVIPKAPAMAWQDWRCEWEGFKKGGCGHKSRRSKGGGIQTERPPQDRHYSMNSL
jgi:hypothetical protein